MFDKIKSLIGEIDSFIPKGKDELEQFRVQYLGKKGVLGEIFAQMKEIAAEDRKEFGLLVNELKNKAEEKVNLFREKFEDQVADNSQSGDLTLPGVSKAPGSFHPITIVRNEINRIFSRIGFNVSDGPEVEDDWHNFTALNLPEYHPARDMQDTFWLTLPGMLMRTHTSSVEIHTMKNRKPPLAIAVPGRAYRNEATDASHDFMFMQLEGLYINKNVSLGHLIATMKSFLQAFFERTDLAIQIRPSYFPFVEPGIEIDMSCPFCKEGCSVCKRTRWIEICGAGLTHPQVLKACNIDHTQYSGFAFGFGLTRLVMLKYGITDIRALHANKLSFLSQF